MSIDKALVEAQKVVANLAKDGYQATSLEVNDHKLYVTVDLSASSSNSRAAGDDHD
jgi:hypothetical protein